MVKKTKMIVKKEEVDVFIAFDGREFENYEDCEKYEQTKRNVNLLEYGPLRGTPPLTTEETYENHIYRWYYLANKGNWDIIQNAYNLKPNNEPTSYPEFVCIDTHDESFNDAWQYNLSDLMRETELFWERFDKKVSFS